MVRGCLGALSSDLHGQNKFHYNTKTLLAFFCCAEICIDGAETIMDKTAGLLAWIKAVSPNCTTSIIVFFTTPYCGKKKLQVPLKNVLHKKGKINFVKSWPLGTTF